jgi:hypothetical protein
VTVVSSLRSLQRGWQVRGSLVSRFTPNEKRCPGLTLGQERRTEQFIRSGRCPHVFRPIYFDCNEFGKVVAHFYLTATVGPRFAGRWATPKPETLRLLPARFTLYLSSGTHCFHAQTAFAHIYPPLLLEKYGVCSCRRWVHRGLHGHPLSDHLHR